MNAARRHELKQNTLALGLQSFPDFWRVYGGKVLLALVAILAIILFIRFRTQSAHEAEQAAAESYAGAVQAIASLQNPPRDPKLASEQRKAVQDQAERAIGQVLETSTDDGLKAEALVARGDLNWTLARMPDLSGATTQTTRPAESRDDALESARKAYEAALALPGAKPLSVTTARLGLAAIAEQRRQWDEAKKQYEAVKNDPRTPKAFKAEAETDLENLAKIQTPVLLGKAATMPATTLPAFPELGATTQPAGSQPAATTGPTSTPAPAPTTTTSQPATVPSR
jgi:predicted negative regulator of RcsB-dependent stress response